MVGDYFPTEGSFLAVECFNGGVTPFFQLPLIRELIIGMAGILLMKHNLLSATQQPAVHNTMERNVMKHRMK